MIKSEHAVVVAQACRRWRWLLAALMLLAGGELAAQSYDNAIRPVALGRKNWLFAGSLLAGQRAANIMSLIQTAKANGHDPHAYLRDVLTRLPMQLNSRIGELLPHTWWPATA